MQNSGTTSFFLHHIIMMRSDASAAPIEIQVFLVTAFASLVVAGYVSVWAVTVRNFWKLGGLLTLMIALLVSRFLLNTVTEIALPVADLVTRLMTTAPLTAVTLLAVIGLTAAYYSHLMWVLAQAAFALAFVNSADRKFLRDLTSRQKSTGFFNRFWGFPPLFNFARRSSLRFAAIAALSVVSALFFSVATALPLVLMGPLEDIARISGRCGPDTGCILERIALVLTHFALPFGAVVVFVVAGWFSQRFLQRLLCFSLEALQEVDDRPPVLFLRAFRDDQVPLQAPRLALFGRVLEIGRRSNSLDRLLLEEATSCGPVVGLGSPADKRPPYGAARGYFSNETWQDAVKNLLTGSIFIAICVDDTAGVWWEIEHLVDPQYLNKTLFLIHPRYASPEANALILEQIARYFSNSQDAKALQDPLPQMRGRSQALAVIGFFRDQDRRLQILHSSNFSRFAYLMTLRMFIRQQVAGE